MTDTVSNTPSPGPLTYDLRGLAKRGIILCWLAIILEFVNLLHTWALIRFVDRANAGNFSMAEADRLDNIGIVILVPFIGLLVAAYINNGIWIYRAAKNAQDLAPAEERMTPGWSIGWFFIPIFSLFMPYRGMRHTWNTSQGHGTDVNRAMPGWFHWWWATWIIVNFVDQISFRVWNGINNDGLRTAGMLDIASLMIGCVSTFYFVRILRQATDGIHSQE